MFMRPDHGSSWRRLSPAVGMHGQSVRERIFPNHGMASLPGWATGDRGVLAPRACGPGPDSGRRATTPGRAAGAVGDGQLGPRAGGKAGYTRAGPRSGILPTAVSRN